MSLASVLDPMRAANRICGRDVFRWRLLSADGKAVTLTCGVPIVVDGTFAQPLAGDALLVIGGFNLDRHVGKNSSGSCRSPPGISTSSPASSQAVGCSGEPACSMAGGRPPTGKSLKISARLFRP